MSELSELIKINKNIEKQNTEIIRLLKIIAGESDFVDRSGYVFPDFDEEDDESEDIFDNFDSLLENEIGVGEVYFIDGDIYRYSVKNNEGRLDNLMGGEVTTTFDMAQNISRESIKEIKALMTIQLYSHLQVKTICQKHCRSAMSRGLKKYSFHGIR